MDKTWVDIYQEFDEIGANSFNLSYNQRRRLINKYRLLGISKSLVLSVLSTILQDCKDTQNTISYTFFNASYLYYDIKNNRFNFSLISPSKK